MPCTNICAFSQTNPRCTGDVLSSREKTVGCFLVKQVLVPPITPEQKLVLSCGLHFHLMSEIERERERERERAEGEMSCDKYAQKNSSSRLQRGYSENPQAVLSLAKKLLGLMISSSRSMNRPLENCSFKFLLWGITSLGVRRHTTHPKVSDVCHFLSVGHKNIVVCRGLEQGKKGQLIQCNKNIPSPTLITQQQFCESFVDGLNMWTCGCSNTRMNGWSCPRLHCEIVWSFETWEWCPDFSLLWATRKGSWKLVSWTVSRGGLITQGFWCLHFLPPTRSWPPLIINTQRGLPQKCGFSCSNQVSYFTVALMRRWAQKYVISLHLFACVTTKVIAMKLRHREQHSIALQFFCTAQCIELLTEISNPAIILFCGKRQRLLSGQRILRDSLFQWFLFYGRQF